MWEPDYEKEANYWIEKDAASKMQTTDRSIRMTAHHHIQIDKEKRGIVIIPQYQPMGCCAFSAPYSLFDTV